MSKKELVISLKSGSMSEKELVIRLKSGSQEAFNLLFHRYERRLFAFSFKLLLSREDAEEVVQEVFFKIWKNRYFLQEDQPFKAFIFTVAKNHIYNLMSKRVSESAYKHYHAGVVDRQVNSTEDSLNFEELKNVIHGKVNEMPQKRKEVFIMSRFEGRTNREIANRLKISLSTVENHLNKALKALKQHLFSHNINFFLLFMFLWY